LRIEQHFFSATVIAARQLSQSASSLRDKTTDGRVCLPSSALPERQCQPCPVLSLLLACAAVAARRLDPLVAAFALSYERETLRNGWFRAATVDHLLGMKLRFQVRGLLSNSMEFFPFKE